MKRYDIKIKAILKKAELTGIEVKQEKGIVTIQTNGLYTYEEVKEIVKDVETEILIVGCKEKVETIDNLCIDTTYNGYDYSIYPKNIKTLNDVKQVINTLISKVMISEDRNIMLDNINDVQIKLNSKLKRTLGYCKYKKSYGEMKIISLDFNKDFIEYEPNNDLKIDTIIHEVMHMLTNLIFNENCGHDSRWKNNCKCYGCSPTLSTVTSYKDVMRKQGIYKYVLRCKNCGKILEYKKTVTKGYRNKVENHHWKHTKCGSDDLEIIEL